jgi:hypothetical protein
VRKPTLFCNPVSKNGEEIKDPAANLTCYEIKENNVEEVVEVDNQFGHQILEVDKSKLLCVPSEEISGAHR